MFVDEKKRFTTQQGVAEYHVKESVQWAGIRRLSPRWDYMAVFSANLDDSGTHPSSPYTVVGGVVFPEQNLTRFEEAWREKLSSKGITIFHASECEAGRGEFDGWSRPESHSFMYDLARIVSRNAEFVMARGARPNDFFHAWDESGLHRNFLRRDVYRGLLQLSLHHLGGWAQTLSPTDALAIFVEKGRKKSTFLNDLYGDVNNNLLGSMLTKTKQIDYVGKEHIPLQAADLVVHEVFKYHPHLGTDTMSKTLRELTRDARTGDMALYPPEAITQLLAFLHEHENDFVSKKPKQ